MFIHKMILLTSATTIMTLSTNATSLSMSTTTTAASEQLSLSSYSTSLIKRLLIVFGSICSLWLIMGLIFASLQTFRHFKRRTHHKFFRYNRPLPLSTSTGQPTKDSPSEDEDDDQASVFTSVSFLSERSKPTHFLAPSERIPEEEFELKLPTPVGESNMAYSQSTLTSSIDGGGPAFLYYPACRNFAYSQSTLASSTVDLHTPTPSVIIPPHDSSNHLKRNPSQSSTTTAFSQITHATYLSSSSVSTSSSVRTPSVKTMPLPTVMITDCDRLQTDIIELEDFEPEKDWRRARPELRLLLNDRMPQAVR